jgi:hypothetical protein
MNFVELQPDCFSYDLSDPLIIPPARTAEIPFGMITPKILHLFLLSLIFVTKL